MRAFSQSARKRRNLFWPITNPCWSAVAVLAAAAILAPGVVQAGFIIINSPLDVDGCVLWLDASDTDTITTTDNGRVNSWADKSFGNDSPDGTVSATGTVRPQTGVNNKDGKNLITFTRSAGEFLTGNAVLPAGHDAYTYFAVWFPVTGNAAVIYEQSSGATYTRGSLFAGTGTQYGFSGQGPDASRIVPYSAGQWQLSAMRVDNLLTLDPNPDPDERDNIFIRANATSSDSFADYSGRVLRGNGDGPETLDLGDLGIRVGAKLNANLSAQENFDGHIAEIIVFDSLLSDGSVNFMDNQLNDVYYYLDQKWNLGLGTTPTIPEPSTLALLAMAVLALGFRPWRR